MDDLIKIMVLIDYSLIKKEYLTLFIYLIFALFLTLIIIGFSYLLALQKPELEKLSIYECGFEPYENSQNQFDIKFCLIAIMFLLFDVEIMFLIPWSVTVAKLNLIGFWSMIDFLIELILGGFYIWFVKALDWD